MTETETRWEQLWLPLWPLASDDLRAGIYRQPRGAALGRRYIETNPRALSNLLVVDVDHPDALMRSIDSRADWLPNAVVENPANGHAHAVWALAEPVTRTDYARRKPLALAAAVTEALRRSVDGDRGYSGLLTKNPDHDSWHASWFTDQLYALDQLADHLTGAGHMPPAGWTKTRRKNPVGLGRNCAIFETARHWAYRELRHHWGDPEGFRVAILERVTELNLGFTEPLPANEAGQIAHSIWKWITTHSRIWADGPVSYEAGFIAIQSARGRMSAGKPRPNRQTVTRRITAELQGES
jgi:hypothetical protein